MGSSQTVVLVGFAALALSTGVAGCGSDDGDGSAATRTGASEAGQTGTTVTIENFAFEPKTLRAKAGDTITVTNTDDTTHTVTADDAAFDTGDVGAAGTATFQVGAPGRYPFHCDIHNYMTGTVTVSEE